MKKPVITIIDAIAVLGIGVCYVEILQWSLGGLYQLLPEPSTSLQKMVLTWSLGLIACGVVFFANALITRQNYLRVGISCSVMGLLYFYIFKFWPHPSQIVLVFTTGYSSLAFASFVALPLLAGVGLNRRMQLNGLAVMFAANKGEQ